MVISSLGTSWRKEKRPARRGPRYEPRQAAPAVVRRGGQAHADRRQGCGLVSEFLLQLHWGGRFGNRLFQYAYGATYARLTGVEFWLPSEWEGTRLFSKQPHKVVEHDDIRLALGNPADGPDALQEKLRAVQRHYPDAELINADSVADPYSRRAVPVCNAGGCLFNPAIFARLSKSHLRGLCEFSDEVKQLECYRRYSDMRGLYDVAHLRRDDISNPEFNRTHVQGYSVISRESYFRAFRNFGYSEDSVLWVSDDYSGKWHPDRQVRHRAGWEYPAGSEYVPGIVFDWLNDFLKLYFARTIFRANSSFSWWAAALSPTARVFSPVLHEHRIYGVHGMEEIEVDFVEGNHPHWMYAEDYARRQIMPEE
jgi:hypothetical protein